MILLISLREKSLKSLCPKSLILLSVILLTLASLDKPEAKSRTSSKVSLDIISYIAGRFTLPQILTLLPTEFINKASPDWILKSLEVFAFINKSYKSSEPITLLFLLSEMFLNEPLSEGPSVLKRILEIEDKGERL